MRKRDQARTRVAVSRIFVALPRVFRSSRIMLEHGRTFGWKPLPHVAACDHFWRLHSSNRQRLHHLAAILVGPLLGPP